MIYNLKDKEGVSEGRREILKKMAGNEERFDGMFLQIAQAAQGIEPLLESMFSFLR